MVKACAPCKGGGNSTVWFVENFYLGTENLLSDISIVRLSLSLFSVKDDLPTTKNIYPRLSKRAGKYVDRIRIGPIPCPKSRFLFYEKRGLDAQVILLLLFRPRIGNLHRRNYFLFRRRRRRRKLTSFVETYIKVVKIRHQSFVFVPPTQHCVFVARKKLQKKYSQKERYCLTRERVEAEVFHSQS